MLVEDRLLTHYGDANLDGRVDGDDFVQFELHFGEPGGWYDGDFNGNGIVDGSDFLVWQRNVGSGVAGLAASSYAVPEPMTNWLLVLGFSVLMYSRQFISYFSSIIRLH